MLTTSPQGELTPLGVIPSYWKFRVAGIFHSGFYQYDSSMAYLRLSDAQRLFSEPDLISHINFKVDDMYKAAEIGKEIEQAAGNGFQTSNWMDENRELFRALWLEKAVTFFVIGLIVLVAALNILIDPDHDGDGKDTRYRRADELWRDAGAGATHLPDARTADQPAWNLGWTGAGVCGFVGRRALPFHPSLVGRVLPRHAALCVVVDRWSAGGSRLDWSLAAGYDLSLVYRGGHSAG